jgi:hypothetical protein
VQISVSHTLKAYEARLAGLPKERMAAAVRSLNRAMTTVRAEASRDMGKEYPGLKIGTIKRQMRMKRATRGDPAASVTFSAKRFRLFGNWNVRQTRKGVLGRLPFRWIETASGELVRPSELSRAFIQRSKAGTPNVWIRVGKDRYPIEALVASSLATAFVERAIGRRLGKVARERFAVVFAQEVSFRLGGSR